MGYDVFSNAREEYEACHTRDERKKFFVRYALLAPSPLNSQPWVFRMRGDAIELCIDRQRVLPEVDAKRRLLYISAGTALRYLEMALNCVGVTYHVQLFPNFSDWDLVASVHLWASRFPERVPSDPALCQACAEDRSLEAGREREQALIDEIAQEENIRIHTITSKADVEAVAGMARQHSVPETGGGPSAASYQELYQAAGVQVRAPTASFMHPDMMIDPLIFDRSVDPPERLMLLSTFADNAVSRVMAGRALGRLQLLYHPVGKALFAFNELIDDEQTRSALSERFDCDRHPQLLVSVRNMIATKPLARRPVAEMIR